MLGTIYRHIVVCALVCVLKKKSVMYKELSKQKLEEKASVVFKDFPNANKVYATTDGNIFIEENRAWLHAGAKGKVIVMERPVVDEPKKVKTAAEIIEEIKSATTTEQLHVFEKDEKRKTVLKAIEDKRTELTIDVNRKEDDAEEEIKETKTDE